MSAQSLSRFVEARLASLHKSLRHRELPKTGSGRETRKLVSFASNDYLGLSQHPDVVQASIDATRLHGAGAGASRLISGNHILYDELEQRLAALKETEDAVVFGSGYLCNIGVIPALVGRSDLICLDELSHSSLLTGGQLARSRVLEFRHNDSEYLGKLLGAHRKKHRHCLIVTEGVFSMDGDIAPLAELAALADSHDAWLMCDDAHGVGVVGGGRGAVFASEPAASLPLQMGTLSKAVGTYGGYLCASRSVCDYIRNRARSFIYSTGLPPGTVAAASKALEIIGRDRALCILPLERARQFTDIMEMPEAQSAIVPFLIGPSDAALEMSAALETAGFLVPAIRPPTVPLATARLRIAFRADHSEADVDNLAEAIRALGASA